ncbi:MAG: hypothetical protein RMN25_05775 [Anaerolineae bacterium]|nr:hypothetical protein [Thermoflexales bacterium]MDW8407274.1 hypothetical protein [Anaerolineae bacterium]
MIRHPVSIYINWAAYDELSDNVELTEELAMRQLEELLRLRRLGVRFDYYLMDAFWYARDGGYRTWRKPHWPNGPDAWLERCLSNGVLPGLWVSGNTTHSHDPVPAWRDSLDAGGWGCCMFSGGFLNHFLESLRLWYARGVRLFKFDFMHFGAATPALERSMLPSEIRAHNMAALIAGLKQLRADCPDLMLLGYNGFEEPIKIGESYYPPQSNTSLPIRKVLDTKWLEVFDAMYCGDPRPADVPAARFWRAKDVYSDHMVRVYELNGYPLARIDNSGFMIGTTGTCYYRKTAAWKGMLLLSLARGGWANTYYGNLDLLSGADAVWFAKAQSLFLPLQAFGQSMTFGALPGTAQPYGFLNLGRNRALITVVNPAQAVLEVELPALPPEIGNERRILFCDAGFVPSLDRRHVRLGPEQMAVIGAGAYAAPEHELGTQEDVVIPSDIRRVQADFVQAGDRAITTTLQAPERAGLRIVFRQTDARGIAKRTTGGSPPNGISLGKLLTVSAHQAGREIALDIEYDKAIWSGLSWAVAEAPANRLQAGAPMTIHCETKEGDAVTLTGDVFAVRYDS